MDSLKRKTAIPNLEKVTEITAGGKPFNPPQPWQLQDNEPAASAGSLSPCPIPFQNKIIRTKTRTHEMLSEDERGIRKG